MLNHVRNSKAFEHKAALDVQYKLMKQSNLFESLDAITYILELIKFT